MACRIERKRAHDREAQRASRAKTKAHISHLEKTVAELTRSSGDNRANYLAQHAAKQAQEIDDLQALVGKIRGLVQDANSPPKLKQEGSTSGSVAGDSSHAEPGSGASWDSPSDDHWHENTKKVEPETTLPTKTPSATRNLIVLGINMLCEEVDDCSYTARLNETMSKIEQTPDNLSSLEEDEDILIRAIVCGWDAAERVHHFDIVWRFLRAFDEGLWFHATTAERLAHFWLVRSTMLHKIQPKNQERRARPSFMEETPAQLAMPSRPSLVDYFAWPAVRDQLLAQGIGKCSGKATIAFSQCFRFVWPYELRDTYKLNKTTGMYSLSEAFLKNYNDVSSFRLTHSDLLPYYVHPSLAAADPPKFDTPPVSESDGSTDDEFFVTHSIADTFNIPGPGSMMDGTTAADWAALGMDISGEAMQYAMDPFSMAYEAVLTHWPSV